MYTQSAEYYDLLYRDLKDYGEEALKIDALLKRLTPPPQRLLDIGCGTGEHAFQLARKHGYQVDGADIEPGFIEIAQRKLPDAQFEVADMCNLDLKRKYDCLLCLFSSIGYVETEARLQKALARFALHLQAGGWLVLEPWVSPDAWRPGQVDVVETADPQSGSAIQRTRTGDIDGNVSVINIEYEIRTGERTQTLSETHRLGLFTQKQMTEALEHAGFTPRWIPAGLQPQPMVLAQRTS